MGDNVIGRRNKDTEGVDAPIITADPSVGRKHCIINVKKNKEGKFIYTVRDFPSLTGTFYRSVLLGKKEQVRIGEGAIITMGATTFILHTANEGEEEEDFYINFRRCTGVKIISYIRAIREIGGIGVGFGRDGYKITFHLRRSSKV